VRGNCGFDIAARNRNGNTVHVFTPGLQVRVRVFTRNLISLCERCKDVIIALSGI
jgi:hypothetical protein